MPLEDILDALEADGREQEKELLETAKVQAKDIIQLAEREAEEIRKRAVATMQQSVEQEKGKLITDARMGVRKRLMVTKEKLVEEAFDEAGNILGTIRSAAGYPDILELLIKEALSSGHEGMVLSVCLEDENAVKEFVAMNQLGVGVENGLKSAGGIKASTVDKRICFDNTIECRLDRARRMIKPEVTSILFG